LDSERLYVDLLFRASKKYASWDPEIVVKVGDYGRISTGRTGLRFWQRNKGTFVKEGNIYEDGKAEKYGIPESKEYGADATEGDTWIVSENAEAIDVSAAVQGQTPVFAQCKIKGAFRFSNDRGAILVMDNDAISTIEPPGCLRKLLKDPSMRNLVLVSQVHRCAAYARLLTAKNGASIAIGLSILPPVTVSGVASASVDVDASWVRSSNSGNFKSKVNKNGNREYYPLFRLVSLREKAVSTGVRGESDEGLPDAVPPWING